MAKRKLYQKITGICLTLLFSLTVASTKITIVNAATTYPDYSTVNVGEGLKAWPTKVFSPYVDSCGYPAPDLGTIAKATKIPYFNLGFVVAKSATDPTPTWGVVFDAANCPLTDYIIAVRKMGGDVVPSFGGAANTPIQQATTDVITIKEEYKKLIMAYDFHRIDFDIEGAACADSASIIRNAQALKMLKEELNAVNYPLSIWLTLPVLPSGLDANGLNCLDLHVKNGAAIDGVNVMTMDYGIGTTVMGKAGIDAITNLQAQMKNVFKKYGYDYSDAKLWNMVGTTPMIGVNDITSEIFTTDDAKQSLDFCNSKGVGEISMWSANRDHAATGTGIGKAADSHCGIAGVEDFAYEKIWSSYNDLTNFNPNITYVPEWRVAAEYSSGAKVIYGGYIWKAQWYSKGETPGSSGSAWVKVDQAQGIGTATLSVDKQTNTDGNYNVTVTIPANSTATSCKLYEGTTVVKSAIIAANSALAQTVIYKVSEKPQGSYIYRADISDATTSSSSSNLEVMVTTPVVNKLQAAALAASTVSNGAYTLTATVPANNTATSYKIMEGTTVASTGTLVAGKNTTQDITLNVTGKAVGTYNYTVVVNDSITSSISNEVSVIVLPTPVGNVPAKPSISYDNWNNGANFNIVMNMWWGENGTSWKLYENGVVVSTKALTANGQNAQTDSVSFTEKEKGTYVYKAELINAAGAIASDSLIYTVK